jgi:hypothetical protein
MLKPAAREISLATSEAEARPRLDAFDTKREPVEPHAGKGCQCYMTHHAMQTKKATEYYPAA